MLRLRLRLRGAGPGALFCLMMGMGLSGVFQTSAFGCLFQGADPREKASPRAVSSGPLPNILVITIDTLRADHLGCYGYARDTSPTLDGLARKSILFERCLVPMAQTLPSHLTLMTGLYPLEHGIVSNMEKPGGRRFSSSKTLRTLAEMLKGQGYQTAAFVSATPVKRESGIGAGFDTFDQPSRARRVAAETNKAALAWLTDHARSRFFVWIHYFDPHAPYKAPEPYNSRYSSDDVLARIMAERHVEARVPKRPGDKHVAPGKKTWDIPQAINGYDGEIRYVDDQIKVVLDRLERAGLADRTVILVMGDHGEGLGQHGVVMHDAVWFEQLHVPLMIYVPGRPGRRFTSALSSVDVLPTLFGLIPGISGKAPLEQCGGRDVLKDETSPRALFGMEPAGRDGWRTLVSGDWKYLFRRPGEDHLYNLKLDPFELADVKEKRVDVVARMRRQLRAVLEEQRVRGRQFAASMPDSPKPSNAEAERRRRELQSLGYLGEDDDDP